MSTTPTTAPAIEPGIRILQRFGPYEVVATVVRVTDRGAVLEYPHLAEFVGFGTTQVAPDGTDLTTDPSQGFLGRAHFAAAEVVS